MLKLPLEKTKIEPESPSAAEKEIALKSLEDGKKLRQEILERRKGELVPASWELIREAREER